MSTYRVGDTRKLAGDIEVWNGEKWCAGLRGWGTDTGTIYLMDNNFTHIQRGNTMSTTERTVTINHVTLTESQVRAALRQLETPTLGNLEPGTYFTADYDTQATPRLLLRAHAQLDNAGNHPKCWFVDANGYLGYDMGHVVVTRVGGFHGTR